MNPLTLVILAVMGFYCIAWLASVAYIIRVVGYSKYLELPLYLSVFLAPAVAMVLWLRGSIENEVSV